MSLRKFGASLISIALSVACGPPAAPSAPASANASDGQAADLDAGPDVIILRCRLEVDGTYTNCRVTKGVAPATDAAFLAAMSSHRHAPVRVPIDDYKFTIRTAKKPH